MSEAPRLAVLIPAYKPSSGLVDLVAALAERGTSTILIVDDGSGPGFADTFARASRYPGVQLLRHAVNLGKGAALKTGINHALCAFPDLAGIVTADADGQHHPKDIEHVAAKLRACPESLVLGSREFDGEVPLRSRFGNVLTRSIMHALMGQKLTDTQTGLRGIPLMLLPRLLRLESTGYEFELEMLLAAHQIGVPIVEVPIQTIYEPGNKSSHFNPIADSMKIYFVLLRFGSISFLTSVLDNLVFYFAYRGLHHILIAQVIGRVMAVAFNYTMVRKSVFYSREQHRAVLPKFLLLVLVSGSVSYGGIRLLVDHGIMAAVPAKVLVETLLFFVNFMVQRLFIFKPLASEGRTAQEPAAGPFAAPSSPPSQLPSEPPAPARGGWAPSRVRLLAWIASLALAAVVGVEVYGFITSRLFAQQIWNPTGLARFTRFIGVYVAFAAPILVLVPWTFTALVCAAVLVLTALAVGPMAVLSAAFLLVAACALGSRLLGRAHEKSLETDICATLLGLSVYIVFMTLTSRLPIHYAATWSILLGAPIVLDMRGVLHRARRWTGMVVSGELRPGWERAAFALLVFVLLMHWVVVLKPETGADGLSVHMAVAANITDNHFMTYEPNRFVWAVMPMGADWMYSVVYLFGGEYAARLFNFAMFLAVEALLYGAVRRWVPRSAAFLLLALFAATPVVQYVTGSLFVENLLAAIVAGLVVCILRLAETGEKKFLYAAALLGGTALSVKFGALAFSGIALPFLAIEARRAKIPARSLAAAAVLFLAAAVPTYAIAWHKTGDPLFPFLNRTFQSPLLQPGEELSDDRFTMPLNWQTPYNLTFRTSKYYEGQNGSFGFQYMGLIPLGILGVIAVRRRSAVAPASVAILGAAAVLASQPNVRYVYPALPLMAVPFAALLGWSLAHRRRLYRGLIVFAVAVTALDAYFVPSSSYYHKDFGMRSPFSATARDEYMGKAAPIRKIIQYFNQAHPGAAVLVTGDSTIAGLTGDVYENHWHQMPIYHRLQRTGNIPNLRRLLDDWKVRFIITPKPPARDEVEPSSLRKFLEDCTAPEYDYRDYYLARVEPACRVAPEPPNTPTVVLRAGAYDDFDPAIIFHGDWVKSRSFDGPDRHTISYSDVPGADVMLAFEGRALTYEYTKASNRGFAEVIVDGVTKGSIDLYSLQTAWQSRSRFCCFGKGTHVVRIKVLGESRPASAGHYVDVDGFVVE